MLLSVSLTLSFAPPNPQVTLAHGGQLKGYVGSNGERVFRGVPYAQPPTGELRFRPPKNKTAWTGVRDALDFGAPCLQPVYPMGGWNSIEDTKNASEDCLFLNVVAPSGGKGGWPVIVYIPAGEFHYGGSADRESDWPTFAPDAVYVSVNSRLGALGYLGSKTLARRSSNGGTGNYGILDQRLALQWVQANIAAFGGDRSNVMLMGESSGATSVSVHLVSPPSWGLFHKAVMQSPGLTQVKQPDDAELNYQYLLSALASVKSPRCLSKDGYTAFDGANMRGRTLGLRKGLDTTEAAAACDAYPSCLAFTMHLRANQSAADVEVTFFSSIAPMSDVRVYLSEEGGTMTTYARAAADGLAGELCIAAASASLINELTPWMPRGDTFETDAFAPVVDGVDMPTPILDAFTAGTVAPGVAVLLGSNLDEGTEFMYLTPPIKCDATADDFSDWALAFYGKALGDAVVDAYQTLEQPLPPCIDPHHGRRRLATAAAKDDPVEAARAEAEVEADVPATKQQQHQQQSGGGGGGGGEVAADGQHYMAAMRSAGDFAITCKVRQVAQQLASKAGHKDKDKDTDGAVYNYFFRHAPAFSVNWANTTGEGAFHGAEVPFVFGDSFELTGADELTLSQHMGAYWRNFAHTGDPNSGPAATPVRWEPFVGGSPKKQATIEFDTPTITSTVGLKAHKCQAFADAQSGLVASRPSAQ